MDHGWNVLEILMRGSEITHNVALPSLISAPQVAARVYHKFLLVLRPVQNRPSRVRLLRHHYQLLLRLQKFCSTFYRLMEVGNEE